MKQLILNISISLSFTPLMIMGQPAFNESGPGFRVMNASHYQCCTMFLNEEPIKWENAPGVTIVRGFPLKYGTNSFRCEMEFLQPKPSTNEFGKGFQGIAMGVLKLEKGTWYEFQHWMEIGPFPEPVEWKFDFVEPEPEKKEPAFDKLAGNSGPLLQESRSLAVKLVKLIMKDDNTKLAKVFGFQDVATAKAKIPGWFPDRRSTKVSPTGTTDESKLIVTMGKHIVLVRCKPGDHLVSFRDQHDVGFALDCLILARFNEKWEIMGNNGEWIALDSAALELNKASQPLKGSVLEK
jgi:hypothetical protein